MIQPRARQSHDQGHRGARGRLEGRRLVRAERTARESPTRRGERILAIADELGWYPNRAARALSAARADACGLVLARPARTLALEPFFMEFISGVESELSARSMALTHPAREGRATRRSRSTGAGGASTGSTASSWSTCASTTRASTSSIRLGTAGRRHRRPARRRLDSFGLARRRPVVIEAVRYLAALGHARIAHVAGVRRLRAHDPADACVPERSEELGLEVEVVETDYSAESGRPRDAPAALRRRRRRRRSSSTATSWPSRVSASRSRWASTVPDDLSIVGWDDSLISQVVHPPLTAITRDIAAYGVRAAEALARGDRRRADG